MLVLLGHFILAWLESNIEENSNRLTRQRRLKFILMCAIYFFHAFNFRLGISQKNVSIFMALQRVAKIAKSMKIPSNYSALNYN